MMRYIVLTLIYSYCLIAADANVETILMPSNYNPVGTPYCQSDVTGVMGIGEEISLEGLCRKATCEKNGKIVIRKCKNIRLSPCGIQTADFTQPFPLCCPRPEPCPSQG